MIDIVRLTLDGRKVVDAEVAVDREDHPDFADAYFDRAVFADTGEVLTDEELDKLGQQNPDELHTLAHRAARYGR